jgi:hypothetical protein
MQFWFARGSEVSIREQLVTKVVLGILSDDLAPGQRLRNEAYFTNLIWDVTQAFRVGGEVTYRKTAYTVLRNNDGIGFQFQVQWKF